ncbi:MAG: hypothetical protein CVU22_06335 [Betaproteobacteria bacterium HGW-Betaproteobacteria-16]|nr:MAG: hypothetical protein CVU22_06335 [Betaproteobacteria bacterium HGW-Betaproteobacteria-16]
MLDLKAFEVEMTKLTMQMIAWEVVTFVIGMFVLYLVLKAAIRDGINESRLGDTWKAQVRAAERTEAEGGKLPPIRADR